MRRLSGFLFLFAVYLQAAVAAAPQPLEGEIGGAKFSIAVPAQWNRAVLLLAHGLRSEDRPLVADLAPDHLAYRTLIEEGWIVAKTSYRRNGLIVGDAIADLDALRDHIVARFGQPDRVLLEGESMGGLIVTLMAEREPGNQPHYHGAVAIGAALQIREPNATIGLNLQPRVPLIFLTNQSELDGPRNYVAADVAREARVEPQLFRVSRDGHVNVNQAERLVAIRALNHWLDRGPGSLPRPKPGAPFPDVTFTASPQPSKVKMNPDGRGFTAKVIEVSAIYGNLFIDAQPADFAAAGIERMTWFELSAGDRTFRAMHGRDFGSVKRGEWVVFPNADGFYWLARNFADAAATGLLKVGDDIRIRRFSAPASIPDVQTATPASPP